MPSVPRSSRRLGKDSLSLLIYPKHNRNHFTYGSFITFMLHLVSTLYLRPLLGLQLIGLTLLTMGSILKRINILQLSHGSKTFVAFSKLPLFTFYIVDKTSLTFIVELSKLSYVVMSHMLSCHDLSGSPPHLGPCGYAAVSLIGLSAFSGFFSVDRSSLAPPLAEKQSTPFARRMLVAIRDVSPPWQSARTGLPTRRESTPWAKIWSSSRHSRSNRRLL